MSQKDINRLMIVPGEDYLPQVRRMLNGHDDDHCRITLFAMQPLTGGHYAQEILGYSVMAALGLCTVGYHHRASALRQFLFSFKGTTVHPCAFWDHSSELEKNGIWFSTEHCTFQASRIISQKET